MVVTGEYATGSIRSTFAAVPKRLPVLWSKLGVFLTATLVLGTIASVLAFVAGQAIFSTKHVDASFGDPHVLRAVLGCGLFLAAMGTFGLAPGALLRNTAAAITTLTLVLFVVPVIVDVLPKGEKIGPYLPSAAGLTITSVSSSGPLGPWAGFGLLCAYIVGTTESDTVGWSMLMATVGLTAGASAIMAIDAPLARWYAPLLLGPTCVVLAVQGGFPNWALATIFVLFFFYALKIIQLVSGDYEARQRAHMLLAQRAEELAVGPVDRHRDVALQTVQPRRVVIGELRMLRDIGRAGDLVLVPADQHAVPGRDHAGLDRVDPHGQGQLVRGPAVLRTVAGRAAMPDDEG
jgi:hypothetical protein